jgi:hypothetical protein
MIFYCPYCIETVAIVVIGSIPYHNDISECNHRQGGRSGFGYLFSSVFTLPILNTHSNPLTVDIRIDVPRGIAVNAAYAVRPVSYSKSRAEAVAHSQAVEQCRSRIARARSAGELPVILLILYFVLFGLRLLKTIHSDAHAVCMKS